MHKGTYQKANNLQYFMNNMNRYDEMMNQKDQRGVGPDGERLSTLLNPINQLENCRCKIHPQKYPFSPKINKISFSSYRASNESLSDGEKDPNSPRRCRECCEEYKLKIQ